MAKKVFNLNTERAKRTPKDDPDKIIEKAASKFAECMILVIPELVHKLQSRLDNALDELKKATIEANKK